MDKSHKLASFEGLRGIAAFVVVIAHLRLAFFATSSDDLQVHLSFLPFVVGRPLRAFLEAFYNGTFAVWLFWIMSGFVLSLQFFLRAHQTPLTRAHDYLEDAFLRRYLRLLVPILASVVFAYVLHARGLMFNLPLAHALGEPYQTGWLGSWYRFPASAGGALKSAAWNAFFSYDDAATYNNVLWTMEKEWYGSLFLFAFLGLLGHRRSRIVVYPLAVLANRKLGLDWLNAFVAGILLCDLFVHRPGLPSLGPARRWPGLSALRRSRVVAALVWGVIVTGSGFSNFRGIAYLFLGTAAIAFTLGSGVTQRVLSSAVPMFLGRISFGLYLIHIPIICSFSCWWFLVTASRLGPLPSVLLGSAATVVLSIAGGYGLYLAADRPGIRVSRWFSRRIMNAGSPQVPTPAENH